MREYIGGKESTSTMVNENKVSQRSDIEFRFWISETDTRKINSMHLRLSEGNPSISTHRRDS